MSAIEFSENGTAVMFCSHILSGGRMTKYKGEVASCAPALVRPSVVFPRLFSAPTVSALALAAGLSVAPVLLPSEITGGAGAAWAACSPSNAGTAGDDIILCDAANDPGGANVSGFTGNDTITLDGMVTVGNISGGDGVDTINLLSGTVINRVVWGNGDESQILDLTNVTLAGDLRFGGGSDNFTLVAGSVGSNVFLGDLENFGTGVDDVFTLDGGHVAWEISGDQDRDTINIYSGSVGRRIKGYDGDDVINWSGGTIGIGVYGDGDWYDGLDWFPTYGSDTVTVSASEYDGTQMLDGGDDAYTSDGYSDTLNLNGLTVSANGTYIVNWEVANLDATALTISDGLWDVGIDGATGSGVFLTNGSELEALDALTLNGNLQIDGTSQFTGTGAGAGVYNINGTVLNSGTITTYDGVTGDVLTISGDYSGDGQLLFDADLASGTGDALVIDGDVTGGTTTIMVNDVTSGPISGNDVVLVDVTGATAEGDFVLAGGPLTVGAYDYDLIYQPGTFVLAGSLNSIGAMYEAAPLILAGFNRLPTLEQRVGERELTGSDTASGSWIRFYGDSSDMATNSGSNISDHRWGLQAGWDERLEPSETGQWVIGVTAQYGTQNASVSMASGAGKVSSSNYGIGATATWYGNDGLYADLQGQVSWISSDFSSSSVGVLATGERANAYAASIETGYRFALDQSRALVPQAQMSQGYVGGAAFTDSQGNAIDLGSSSGLTGRLGLAYEYERSDDAAGGHAKLYAIGNLLHDFSEGSTVQVAGLDLNEGTARNWGEVGIGTSFASDENTMFYGEASYRTALDGPDGTNNGFSATAGLRINW
ncbi:autotransporter outer membrane beta-barrel domain-containing protein [Celeribacter neptunius]|uniref:Outer membrane autotransporter barrel domain-containing protein n=1 Tax=Celeribacter neptunius TaxID=588602 RepID=A0A1I3TCE7_9RHOB|nr:autotransporter outer membrane beta-barrel domain-containing protein [Celeribacter neptunius]SFJ67167.1 outer membrane autotransporter barrel domain-containing protein [Celeribacter neptunius]